MFSFFIFISIFLTFFGRTVFFVIASWQLIHLEGGAVWISIFFLLQNFADILFGSAVGELVDRKDRRHVYAGAELIRVGVLAVAFMVMLSAPAPQIVAMTICALGVISITIDRCAIASYQGLFAEVYPAARLLRVNSRSMLLNQLGSMSGALVGGYLAHKIGFAYGIVVLLGCFALGALSIMLWVPRERAGFMAARPERSTWLSGVRDGLRVIGANADLRTQVIFQIAVLSFITLTNAALPGFVAFHLQRDGSVFGQLDSIWASGAILASFAIARITARFEGSLGYILLFILALAIALFGLQKSYYLSMLFYGALGFIVAFSRIWSDSRVQRLNAVQYAGRVRSTITVITGLISGTLLVGMAVFHDVIGPSYPYIVMSAGIFLIAVQMYCVRKSGMLRVGF